MEDKQIFNNLKGLKAIKPENVWKQGLKAQLFDIEDSRTTAFSRGFLPFNFRFNLKGLNFAPALIPIALVSLVLFGGFMLLNIGQDPEKIAEQVNYFVLLETKLNEANTAEDMQGIVSMFEQASDSISDTVENPKQTAEQAVRITKKAQEKIEQMRDIGEETKDLEVANQVFASKAAEFFVKPDIENAQKELVANLIDYYESRTLSNPQLELLNQAKEYYNNQQFQLALETILKISE